MIKIIVTLIISVIINFTVINDSHSIDYESPLKGEIYNGSYAFLVGVSNYTDHWGNLSGVPRDINNLKLNLENKGFKVITEINPINSDYLENKLNNFIQEYGQEFNNRLIFYFSGHGYTKSAISIGKIGYFVLGNAGNPDKSFSNFRENSIDMKKIKYYSEANILSKHALFIFDSCFSGTVFSAQKSPPPEQIERVINLPVRSFIASGTENQTVPDNGVFLNNLLNGIDGDADHNNDGFITSTELGIFLQKKISVNSNNRQTPQFGKLSPGFDRGDFLFKLNKKIIKNNKLDEITDSLDEIISNTKGKTSIKCKVIEEKLLYISGLFDGQPLNDKKINRKKIGDLFNKINRCKNSSNFSYNCKCIE